MKLNKTLWTLQAVLAALFLFAGAMKLVTPIEAMAGPIALPGGLLRFIGVAEVLGAIGLVLPWLLRIQPQLTALAAAGLAVIMIGAVVLTATTAGAAAAAFPFLVGGALALIIYGRSQAAAAA
jgi:DoxX-like family